MNTLKRKTLLASVIAAVFALPSRSGTVLGALHLEVDKLDAVPEFQRAWYTEDPATKKFKLDPSRVDIEDTSGLKATVAATRKEAAEAKSRADREAADKIREALKPYEGIDPAQAREMLAQFASEEEKKLIASGPQGIEKVIAARMEKKTAEQDKLIKTALEERDGALEVASAYMEKVLDNHVMRAASDAGIIPAAMEDALSAARRVFQLNDEGEAVQYDESGNNVILNKEGKGPFSVKDWIEERKADKAHWFPSGSSGGGAGGNKNGKGGVLNTTGLSPTAKLNAAREHQAAQARK